MKMFVAFRAVDVQDGSAHASQRANVTTESDHTSARFVTTATAATTVAATVAATATAAATAAAAAIAASAADLCTPTGIASVDGHRRNGSRRSRGCWRGCCRCR